MQDGYPRILSGSLHIGQLTIWEALSVCVQCYVLEADIIETANRAISKFLHDLVSKFV